MPDVLDPSGFQIAVILRTGGEAFPLWIGGAVQGDNTIYQSDDPNNSLFRDIPIVESVQVEIGMGLIGKVNVEIAAPFDLGLKLLESSLFAIGSVLDVQIGYPRIGKFMPWFSTMTSKPSINLNPDDGLTATLNGEGGAFAADRGSSSETFTGSYESIVREIAAQESNRWNLDIPSSTGEDDPLYVERGEVSQANRTDWMFVQHICRLANYDAWITPDPEFRGANLLRLRRRADSMAGKPRYTFIARGQCDFINSFPILSFESSAEGVWLPPGSREVRAADVNIITRDASEVVVRPEDTDVPTLPGDTTSGEGAEEADGTVVATEPIPRDARGTGRRVIVPSHAPEEAAEALNSMVTEARQHGGLNATFSSIGLPDLFPGEAIAMAGLGIFSGNYIVESVSHSAAPGEWTMTMKLLGDGVDARGMSSAVSRSWARFNNEEVENIIEAGGGLSTRVDPYSLEGI